MIVYCVARFLLAAAVALALPLAVEAFLWGAHVTPEQGLRHRAAVAWQGAHVHATTAGADHHDHDGSAAPAPAGASPVTDVSPALATNPPAPFGSGWLGLVAGALALRTLPCRRLGRRGAVLAPAGHVPAVMLPPPRQA
jgi:hypothetical protein